ncbi:nucleoside hydrolase [Pelagicoccus mobilis]|uniref:Nucleoside hydrolase n=1 Tax=Pelagicoccus mobilis TaxID=415221 RepID=A0A934S1R3_9BACT|nr:nucleoside hydrolase [Pelagicoccus mobilis]MBK1879570.1 nucleoside hydrolase [Pelagicoccus mobilis]
MSKFARNVLPFLSIACSLLSSCQEPASPKHSVIFDTDANNELDDQNALAYLLLNGNDFVVRGITSNATYNGGDASEHLAEAERVLRLCDLYGEVRLIEGATAKFEEIAPKLDTPDYDGHQAVDFIIEQAHQHDQEPLILLAVGKLTNVALAVKKDPSIIEKVKLVWLGSNYPDPGEYNLINDIPSMNYLLDTDIHFEMVTVRYGKPSGTDAVKITKEQAPKLLAGLGPQVQEPVTGRHGGTFKNFGDYSVDLFEHIEYYGTPPSRALFDMAAVAIVKDPTWAEATPIPSPKMVDEKWVDQPDNPRQITLWENFDKQAIIADFLSTLTDYKQVSSN